MRGFGDAIVGIDQKVEVFHRCVNEFYEIIKPAYQARHNDKSIELCIGKVLAECLSFAGCVAKISNSRPNGCSDDDVVYLATALYNKLQVSTAIEDCRLPF